MSPQRKRTLATLMVIVLAVPALLAAVGALRKTSGRAPTRHTSEAVVFDGAPGWSGARGPCTEVRPEDGCDSEWRHESGQVARVFVVEVPSKEALGGFVDRLDEAVTKSGGVVERIPQGELTLVRFLQTAPDGLATINYALTGEKLQALHLITSVVPFDQQKEADVRLRALLEHASWAAPASS